jgi:hypothetical protein
VCGRRLGGTVPRRRGFNSFPFQLNLSSSAHR